MKKNAIDGMLNQLNYNHHNEFLVQDPEIPSTIGILKIGNQA